MYQVRCGKMIRKCELLQSVRFWCEFHNSKSVQTEVWVKHGRKGWRQVSISPIGEIKFNNLEVKNG